MQAAVVCVAMVVALPSCDGDDEITEDEGDEVVDPTDPEPEPETDPGTGTTTKENVFVTTDVITPIRYAEGNYYSEGTEDVTIEVTSLTTDDIVFTVAPSSEVKSYLVQIYPLAAVYNTLINEMNSAGASSMTLDECTSYLQQVITSESSGGELMNEETLGSDFADYEFDWGNSGYLSFTIQQESEYLIVVQACFDEAGETNADLCLVHVTTPAVDLQGSPEVTATIEVGYSSYVCTFSPNSDCYYIYYLVGDYDEIYQYVDAYGEGMYRDFLRHYGGRVSADSSDDLVSYASNLEESAHMVATAIPLDANGTPAANVYFQEFSLNERPEGRVEATASMGVVKCSAHALHFKAEMDMYTKCIYYNVMEISEAQTYMDADDETREAYAETLAMYGYGWANPNYSFDSANDVYTGTSATVENYWTMSPETEYAFVWTAQNAYGDLTDLNFSTFTMKALVTDAPETSKEDVVFTIPSTTRTSMTLDFTYNPENTAVYFFQYYYPVVDNGDPEDEDYEPVVFPDTQDGSDEARYAERGWLYWFFEQGWANAWLSENTTHESFTPYGYESATHYEYAYIGEDWDGVVGYVKFVSCDTKGNDGGPDPQITNVSWNSSTGYVTFETNDDSKTLYYAVVDYGGTNSDVAMLPDLLKRGSGDYYKSEYLSTWREWLADIDGNGEDPGGLTTTEYSGRVPINLDSQISIALAMAEGTAEDGSAVYTDLYAYVYTPSVGLQTFEDYWNETGVVVTPSNN